MKAFRTIIFAALLLTTVWISHAEEATDSVSYLKEKGIITGYADGSMRLEGSINRAEFLKIIMREKELGGSDCFSDVKEEWFAPYVCAAKEAGIVKGYADGSFRPANQVTLVEALKMMMQAILTTELEESGEWYQVYLDEAVERSVIPPTLNFYAEPLTRGEAFEMLWRLMANVQDQPAMSLEEFKGHTCNDYIPEDLPKVDDAKIRETWLAWTNEARAAQGLSAYTYNSQLDRTAYTWSAFSRDRGYMDHKRVGQTAYYDYRMIETWFKNLGVTFKSVGGYTFTENIGKGPYRCRDEECTDELIKAIKYTWDYFIGEAGKDYRPHWNSIMSPSFKEIGFGIVITDSAYYFTVHYGTEITSEVVGICD